MTDREEDAKQHAESANNLWSVCERDDVEQLKEALDHGVDCNMQNKEGWTLAHAAAHGGSARSLQLLISRGANLDVVDKKGRTIAHKAAHRGHLSILKILKNKTQLDQRDVDGNTPYDLSTRASVQALLADVNKYSKTAGASAKEREAGKDSARNSQSSKAQGKFKGQEYRRVPFSGKKKREQLKQKRARQSQHGEVKNEESSRDLISLDGKAADGYGRSKKNSFANPISQDSHCTNKAGSLFSVFHGQTQEELKRLRLDSSRPLEYRYPVEVSSMQPCNLNDVGESTEFPKRPKWSYDMSAEELQFVEEEYFQDFLQRLQAKFPPSDLNFFEQNLNVWRQLWRLIERSDILLLLLDARLPLLHYNSHFVRYIQDEMQKKVILVITKCDLVPRDCVTQWIQYLEDLDPRVEVIGTSAPPNASASGDPIRFQVAQDRVSRQRRESKYAILSRIAKSCERITMASGQKSPHSIREILLQDVELQDFISAQEIIKNEDWSEGPSNPFSRHEGLSDNNHYLEEDDEECEEAEEDDKLVEQDICYEDKDEPKFPLDIVVRIGIVGHPNMGKSSLINALMGKKTVSVSRTPGHTKHLQTLFLSRHCMLIDGPGLVFPRAGVPPGIQVAFGLIPIAQIREPYIVVRYLAENAIPRIEKYYELQIPESEVISAEPISNNGTGGGRADTLAQNGFPRQIFYSSVEDFHWSPIALCEAFAEKHGWKLARSGRPDTFRAANFMLRAALAGTGLYLSFLPPQD